LHHHNALSLNLVVQYGHTPYFCDRGFTGVAKPLYASQHIPNLRATISKVLMDIQHNVITQLQTSVLAHSERFIPSF
jgi:hypothetical protein